MFYFTFVIIFVTVFVPPLFCLPTVCLFVPVFFLGGGHSPPWQNPSQQKESMATQATKSAWTAERTKKEPEYYSSLREEYSSFSGNELIVVPSEIEVITTRNLSLLTADVNTRKCIAVTRIMMEEALNIGANVLDRRSKAMWDILLSTRVPGRS